MFRFFERGPEAPKPPTPEGLDVRIEQLKKDREALVKWMRQPDAKHPDDPKRLAEIDEQTARLEAERSAMSPEQEKSKAE